MPKTDALMGEYSRFLDRKPGLADTAVDFFLSSALNARADAFKGIDSVGATLLRWSYNAILTRNHQAPVTREELVGGAFEINQMISDPGQKESAKQMAETLDLPSLTTFVEAVVKARLPFRPLLGLPRAGEAQRKHLKDTYGFDAPRSVVIEVTDRCNLGGKNACPRCFKAAPDEGEDAKPGTLLRLAKECEFLGTDIVVFSGGEPTLRLGEITEAVKKTPNVLFFMFTNSVLFSQKPELVKQLPPTLIPIISLSPSFDENPIMAIRAQNRITKAIANLHNAGRFFISSLVVDNSLLENQNAVDGINRQLNTWKPGGLLLLPYMPIGNEADTSLAIDGNRPQRLFELSKRITGVPFVGTEYSSSFYTRGDQCPAGKDLAIIRPQQGIVGICPYDPHGIQFDPEKSGAFIHAWASFIDKADALRPDRTRCQMYKDQGVK